MNMSQSRPGETNGRCKYRQSTVNRALELHKEGYRQSEISRMIKVPRATISDWLVGRRRAQMSAAEQAKYLSDIEEERRAAEEEEYLARTTYVIGKPPGAEAYYCGNYYKRGMYNRVCWWNGEEGLYSTCKRSDVGGGGIRRTRERIT